MGRATIKSVRATFDAGERPYEHVDLDAATRLGGAMVLVGFAFALASLPLSPPSGPLGIAGAAGCLAFALGLGISLLRTQRARPDALLAGVYLSLLAAALYRAAAGAGAPFEQLLFIIAVYACAIHPPRRTLLVLFCASVVACTPVFYEAVGSTFAARTVSQLLLVWSIGLIVMGWMIRVRRQRGDAEVAFALARVDDLTGLKNRRALEEALPAAIAHTRRHDHSLSLLVADMDDFKGINDAFGHPAGDQMLRKAAESITRALRLPDGCFRWGGDEFVAILSEADLDGAREIASRVQSTVALSCRTPEGRPLRVTVGAAQLEPGETGADLLNRADALLLTTKARRRAACSVA